MDFSENMMTVSSKNYLYMLAVWIKEAQEVN
jgi:hypothetical protein